MNDVKEHWKILNGVMGKINNKCDLPSAFKNGDVWISNLKDNAEYMNNYYADVGPSTNRSVGLVYAHLSRFCSFPTSNCNSSDQNNFACVTDFDIFDMTFHPVYIHKTTKDEGIAMIFTCTFCSPLSIHFYRCPHGLKSLYIDYLLLV